MSDRSSDNGFLMVGLALIVTGVVFLMHNYAINALQDRVQTIEQRLEIVHTEKEPLLEENDVK